MEPLDEARQGLAEEAVDRAREIAKRYARIFPEHAEDFESSANWGIIRAAASHRPEEGVWDRWLDLCVKGSVRNVLRDRPRVSAAIWGQPEGWYMPEECPWESEEAIDKLLSLLPANYREICALVYKEGLSPYSAGQALGYSGTNGCNIHARALAFLREALAA